MTVTGSGSWLNELTLDKLHRLATAIGAPCSGTKSARIQGIRRVTMSDVTGGGGAMRQRPNLSLLSIDMGIRNLAFAHITATAGTGTEPDLGSGGSRYGLPTIQAWRRLAVPHSLEATENGTANAGGERLSTANSSIVKEAKESFEPADYSRHAYNLITDMLRTYEPNQILIERQRFRSSGQSAVQEWTIRVGVFEGMLYAVLRTLAEERKLQLSIEPTQPARVNRYWLDPRGNGKSLPSSGKKLTGREVKRAKIDLVGNMLQVAQPGFSVSQGLKPFTDEYLSTWKNGARRKRATSSSSPSKLDDLADSLLQGLAWIDWENNRSRIAVLGRDAVDMESGALR